MKQNINIPKLRELCFNAKVFPAEILDWIQREKLWNIWVPKSYGGLELPLTEGLNKLRTLAKIDGSLGWTVTLCSGANFFIGNLQEEVAKEIFIEPDKPICFGGSGGVFGTAEKVGDTYKISGKWRYATGSDYLTQFTLNAKIVQNGQELKENDGSPKIRSFIIPRKEVRIIKDWDSMGLKATVTNSFEVKGAQVDERYSFVYDRFYLPQPIFKVPFSIFADLTLWVNYLGMAEHFLKEAETVLPNGKLGGLTSVISVSDEEIARFSEEIEKAVKNGTNVNPEYMTEIHREAIHSVRSISSAIIQVYPLLGIRASRKDHALNQIFRDYFTATQHHIFH